MKLTESSEKLLADLHELHDSFGEDLFARGFFVSRSSPVFLPTTWSTRTFQGWKIHHDPRLSVVVLEREDVTVCLMGEAFDVRWPTHANEHIAERLSTQLRMSIAAFLSETDQLNGRFMVLYARGSEKPRVVNDATGMRAVFHNKDASALASHASLLAVNIGATGRSLDTIRSRFGFPGRRTAYEGVMLLVPNHTLELGYGKLHRFYPALGLTEIPAQQAAELVVNELRASVQAIVHRFPRTVVALTGGSDSRTTLAATHEVASEIEYFTYYRDPHADTDLADRVIASRLAGKLGLRHTVLDLGPASHSQVPWQFTHLCRQLSYYRHLPRAAFAYYSQFRGVFDAHIRSNVSALVKATFHKVRRFDRQLLSPPDLVDAYRSTFRDKDISDEEEATLLADFDDLFEAGEFSRVAGLRDTRDVFYWEHRMGAWHSLAVLESDPSFESFSIFNSRRVLDTLLSPPVESRAEAEHLEAIIRLCWPAVLQEPINPKDLTVDDLAS